MFRNFNSKQVKLGLAAIAVVITLMAATSWAIAAPACRKVSGKFTLQPVSGPTCTSPVGICATGVYQGGIKGDSQFTGTSLNLTVDTSTTGVVLLTGDNVIHTDDGDLMTKDAIVLDTAGAGDFAELDTVIGGTGAWAGAAGHLSANGTFTSAGGEGDYSGEICLP